MNFLVKSSKKSSFFWIFLCRNSSSIKATDSSSFLIKTIILLLLILLRLLWLSINHSITSYQVTLREEILFLGLLSVFLSFFFIFRILAYWDHYIKVSGFDSHKPCKMYKPSHLKQRTISLLSVRHTGSLLHEFIACVCFLLHLSCWPEEGRVYLIDHQ